MKKPLVIAPLPDSIRAERAAIVAADPTNQKPVPFDLTKWRELFAHKPAVSADVEWLCENFPDGISRVHLFGLGDSARNGDVHADQRLLIGTFMFGYELGGRGYIHAPNTLGALDLADRLEDVSQSLAKHGLATAYRAFSEPRNIAGYDVGFFTKYLYFHSFTDMTWPADRPKPLIFDSFVKASIWFVETFYESGLDVIQRGSDVQKYQQFCDTMHAWGQELLVPPDHLEYFLYEVNSGRGKGGSNPFIFDRDELLVRVTDLVVREVASGTASPALIALAEALPPGFRLAAERRLANP